MAQISLIRGYLFVELVTVTADRAGTMDFMASLLARHAPRSDGYAAAATRVAALAAMRFRRAAGAIGADRVRTGTEPIEQAAVAGTALECGFL